MLIQIPNWTIPTQVQAEAAREHLDQISLGVFSQEEEDDKQKLRGSICSLQLEHLEEEDDVKTEDLDKIWLAYWHIDSLPIDVNKPILTWLE